MRFLIRSIIALVVLFVVSSVFAQQQPPQHANFDIRVSAALRNDLAGTLIKMQQLGACDVSCHLVIARVLVAIDTATPVEPAKDAPEETQQPIPAKPE